jgi:TPP-dependent pyruvate/acetoin dehydrogenase alpha subunit
MQNGLMPDYRIIEDDLTGPDIAALLRLHLDEMHQWSPPESVHAMPIERLRQHLTLIGEWDDERHTAALKEAVEQVRAAGKESEAIGTLGQSRPSVKTMFEEVYATEDWRLVEQRREVGV